MGHQRVEYQTGGNLAISSTIFSVFCSTKNMMSPSTAHSDLLFMLYYHIEAFEESQSCSNS